MLTRLKISNFVLIDKLDLDFKSGLTVLTGETGSGKSIIIDALMLIFGARAATTIIRNGADTTDLVAEFELSNINAIKWLKENDLADNDDQHNLICRRIIDQNGKNKIYLNGNSVTVAQIKNLAEYILDIHTQHAAITLLKQDSQRVLLDEYANLTNNVTTLATYYHKIAKLQITINNLKNNSTKLLERRIELENSINELENLNLKPGEWAELENRHRQISNMGIVVQELDNIQNFINNEEFSLIKSIHTINSSLHKISNYLPTADNLLKALDSIEIDVTEFESDISNALKSIEIEPDELQTLEAKIEEVFKISRKYRIEANQIPDYLLELQAELHSLADNTNLESLEKELADLTESYTRIAKNVTLIRNKTALELSHEVTKILHHLGINGEFKAAIIPNQGISSYGLENIEFNVAFNRGIALQPLARVASGGELSRTALALYLLLSMQNSPETIIFDEIDVGIGGVIASHIGKMLHTLGKNKQVLCITHMAQTASFGNNHLVVTKENQKDLTTLRATYFEKDGRIKEIARMIGGVKITETTINHAYEMLEHSELSALS